MTTRVGVIARGSTAGGCARLILPDGDLELIEPGLTDEDIAARFDLDVVRHAEEIDWCRGVCRDGPCAGRQVYAVNRVGAKVKIQFVAGPGGASAEYEVTRVASGAHPAELRLAQPAPTGTQPGPAA